MAGWWREVEVCRRIIDISIGKSNSMGRQMNFLNSGVISIAISEIFRCFPWKEDGFGRIWFPILKVGLGATPTKYSENDRFIILFTVALLFSDQTTLGNSWGQYKWAHEDTVNGNKDLPVDALYLLSNSSWHLLRSSRRKVWNENKYDNHDKILCKMANQWKPYFKMGHCPKFPSLQTS